MTDEKELPVAREPEDLGRLLQERGNAGDVDGLVALFEPNAVVGFPDNPSIGHDAIRPLFENLLADGREFRGEVQPALRNGDYALTSTRSGSRITTEVAHRQPDGSWRFMIDMPDIARMV